MLKGFNLGTLLIVIVGVILGMWAGKKLNLV
jgi:hypothetical protein